MMKYTMILLAIFLLSSFMMKDEASTEKDFMIRIREESMLMNNLYVITPDSIVVQKENRPQEIHSSVVVKLNKAQRAEIEKLLTQIPWSTLKESYTDDRAPADLYEYQFTFEWEGQTRRVSIYQYKQEEIFALVQSLNQMISTASADFKIGYTDVYFRNKR